MGHLVYCVVNVVIIIIIHLGTEGEQPHTRSVVNSASTLAAREDEGMKNLIGLSSINDLYFNVHVGPENLRQLLNELHEVVDWFHLGIQLGVSEYHLQMISEAHPRDPTRCRTEMLSLWMKTTSELKWSTVVQALAMIGSRTLSGILAQKYGTSK